MTITRYRTLLIASLIVGVLGALVDVIFPALVSEEFRKLQETQDESAPISQVLMFSSLGLVGGVCVLVSLFGLYRFRRWAPKLALIGTALTLVAWPFSGAFTQSGTAIALSFIASYLWGA